MISLMCVFGPSYREHDTERQDLFLDAYDINAIHVAACLGGVLLLPFFTQVATYALSAPYKHVFVLRVMFMMVWLVSNFATVV